MITSSDIALFQKFIDAPAHAFGGKGQEAVVSDTEKQQYWRIYQKIAEACESAVSSLGLGEQLFVKPQNYSEHRGSRGHRPKDLWCAVRNIDSAAFNQMPQIYIIVSHRGIEVGFAVSISEDDYYDAEVKAQNRLIIPRIHRKLPVSGPIIEAVQKFVSSSAQWYVNSKTRLLAGDVGFDVFDSPVALFHALKSAGVAKGGGAICCVITAKDIETASVDVEALFTKTLTVFSDLLLLCKPGEPDRLAITAMHEILEYSPEDPLPEIANDEDARQRRLREIAVRFGQKKFRADLIDAYGGRCSVSGCDVVEVLQAAHIKPYRGKHTNHVSNGTLLRADIHNLFDLFMLSIDPKTYKVIVSDVIRDTEYGQFHLAEMRTPRRNADAPSKDALSWHFDRFQKFAGLDSDQLTAAI